MNDSPKPVEGVTIDPASLFNNIEERQVEFSGEASGDPYRFALRYDAIEALIGSSPDEEAVQQTRANLSRVAEAAGRALGRDYDQPLVVISENDLV